MVLPTRRLAYTLALLVSASFLLTLLFWSRSDDSWIDWSQSSWAGLQPLELDANGNPPRVEYSPGTSAPRNYKYTKTLVVPRTKEEDVSWMEQLPSDIERAIYIVNDRHAPLHPPKNKGHEVMVYLTHIIDRYDNLSDVTLFMHAHQFAWHNSELFDNDAAPMISRLNPDRVVRQGFMNLRCQWFPGCPDWLHPGGEGHGGEKAEEPLIGKAWAELFPMDPVPDTLAAACCAQFALSRDRVRALPRSMYVRYRDWLLHTPLRDSISGRVWEYLWQFVFTGQATWCPAEHVCTCDGFGVCFADAAEYERWWALRTDRDETNMKWLEWEEKGRLWDEALERGDDPDELRLDRPTPGMADVFNAKIEEAQAVMDGLFEAALRRGEDPRIRAELSGLEFVEEQGKGF